MTQIPTAKRMSNLRRWNISVGFAHAVQAIAIIVLSNDFTLPVTATFMTTAPGLAPPELRELFSLNLAFGVASFSLLSAVAHFAVSAPGGFDWYASQIRRGRNYARWVEYSISASVMIVLIAMLTGISDVAALGAIFAANTAMILFGWLMEKYESPGQPSWMPFLFGSVIGLMPWILVGVYLLSPGLDASPPGFVYGIYFSLFCFFNVFALNMVLQYRQTGRWREYVFGEKAYIILSLVAKSLLAWQVFSGTLTA